MLSQAPDTPGRFAGATDQDWHVALDDAARVGLLTRLSAVLYRIHPALPGYLSAQWRQEEPAGHDALREAATRALVTACAAASGWLNQQIEAGDAGLAYTTIGLQRRTLGSALRYALAHGLWEDAHSIARPLDSYWETQGLTEEADAWADQVRLASEDADGTPPDIETPAGALWLFITDRQATRHVRLLRLNEAEAAYHRICARLEILAPSEQQRRDLSFNYCRLGLVAQQGSRLDDAEDWYRKALTIYTELGDKPGIASTYNQLGWITRLRGRLDHAENWYRKSLAIDEEIGDKRGIARTYDHLGNTASQRGRPDEAEDWHRKALAINIELGDKRGMAAVCSQLGAAAQRGDRLDDAQDWYRKALAINIELGDKRAMAAECSQLGNTALQRGRPGEAEDWHRKALVIYEELANKPGMARAYGNLALLAITNSDDNQALEWAVRYAALFDEFPHPSAMTGPHHLAWLTHHLGIGAVEKCWQKVTGDALPQAVRDYVEASSA